MGLNLDDLGKTQNRWMPMSGKLSGLDVLLKYSSPRESERFRQKLVRDGILKSGKGGWQINSHREDDFFKAFAEFYVLDWRGDINPKDAPYDAGQWGRVLAESGSAFEQVSNAISEDEDFFAPTNGE